MTETLVGEALGEGSLERAGLGPQCVCAVMWVEKPSCEPLSCELLSREPLSREPLSCEP